MIDIKTVKLLDLIPGSMKNDAQVQAAAHSIEAELQAVAAAIPSALLLARLDELPDIILDCLAWQFHVDFYEGAVLTSETKRALIRQSVDWHRHKGTPAVIQQVVDAVLSNGKVVEWFEYDGQPYCFKVTAQDNMGDGKIVSRLIDIINAVKNTRSWLEKVTVESVYPSSWYFSAIVSESENVTIRLPEISDQSAVFTGAFGGALYINEKMEVRNG